MKKRGTSLIWAVKNGVGRGSYYVQWDSMRGQMWDISNTSGLPFPLILVAFTRSEVRSTRPPLLPTRVKAEMKSFLTFQSEESTNGDAARRAVC